MVGTNPIQSTEFRASRKRWAKESGGYAGLADTPLASYVHFSEGQNCPSASRTPKCSCRTERGEYKHLVEFGNQFLRIGWSRQDSIILHTPIGIYVGFNNQGISVQRTHLPERRRCKLRRRIDQYRNVVR